jgi:hypothetical protein
LFPHIFHLKAERFILGSCGQLRLALLISILTHCSVFMFIRD